MRKILLVPILLIALLMPVFADIPTITLSEAIESAMENNTDMEKARLELQSSLRSASNISQYIPDLSLTGSATFIGSIKNQSWSNSGSFSAGISMGLGTSLIGSTAVNNAARMLANLNYAIETSSLEQSVTKSYWTLVSSKKSIESAQSDLEASERTLESTKASYEAGMASSLDLANAELTVLRYQYALKLLEDAYIISQEAFRTLTGIEGDFDVTDFPEIVYLSLPSAEELYKEYGESTNSIKMLNASVSSKEAALTLQQVSNLYPSVSLALNYNVGLDYNVTGTTDFEKANKFSDDFTARVTVSVPISSYIPGSSANNNLKNAKDSVAISKIELNAGRKELLSSIRSLLTTIEQNRSNIEICSKLSDTAEKTYELALESYNAGLISSSELQSKMDSLSSAQLDLISAKSEYIQNVYSLAFMLNIDYESLVTLYAEK